MSYQHVQREKLARLSAEIHAITDKCEREGRRGLNSAEREKFHRLEAEFTQTEDSLTAAEFSASILNGSRFSEEELRDTFRSNPRHRDQSPHARAFSAFLRGGMESLDPSAKALMQSKFQNAQSGAGGASGGNGSAGGYTVPQGFSDQLEEAKLWFGGIDGVVEKFTTETGNPMPWPTINDTQNVGRIIGQNVQVTETDLSFGQVTFGSYIGSSDLVLIPLALMQDAYFDLDSLTARLLGTRLGRLYNRKCTIGTGNSEPTGIVTAAVAAGNTNVFPTGETVSIAYDDLVNIEHAVDPSYRYNPGTRWMFNDATLKLLKKLVDSNNRPLWQPGLEASFRGGAAVDLLAAKPTILDHPYIINQDMPVPAANANSVLFGDMSTFKVREAGGTTVMRLVERYADYLQVGFIAYQRFDSNLVDAGTHPLVVGVQSAS